MSNNYQFRVTLTRPDGTGHECEFTINPDEFRFVQPYDLFTVEAPVFKPTRSILEPQAQSIDHNREAFAQQLGQRIAESFIKCIESKDTVNGTKRPKRKS